MTLVKDLARAKAEEVLAEYWGEALPVDPARIAERVGMSVWTAKLPERESGRIVKQAGQAANIYLAADEPPGRQNFTCAHELGHWFERQDQGDDEYSFIDRRGPAEMDAHEFYADHFAANLLMPAERFIDAFDQGLTLGELAARFGVTRAAADKRVKLLGLAS